MRRAVARLVGHCAVCLSLTLSPDYLTIDWTAAKLRFQQEILSSILLKFVVVVDTEASTLAGSHYVFCARVHLLSKRCIFVAACEHKGEASKFLFEHLLEKEFAVIALNILHHQNCRMLKSFRETFQKLVSLSMAKYAFHHEQLKHNFSQFAPKITNSEE